jgi:uncharacterized protein (DUF58 family)
MGDMDKTAVPTQIRLRHKLPLLWLLFLLVAALLLPHRIWNTLLIGLGGLFLVAYGWVWLLGQGLYAERRLRFGWVAVGDRLSEAFRIENRSGIPALWLEIIDESNVPGYQVNVVRTIDAHSENHWRQAAVCQQRGQFRLGPWTIRSSDPFGIFSLTRHYPQTEEIIIHPPIHHHLPLPLPTGQRSGQARQPRRAWEATVNAATVRDYAHGDPLNWIHWPSTARHDELLVRQFDQDTAGDLWLLLDLEAGVQLGSGLDGTEEQAVLLATSLAVRALAAQRPVGLAAYGRSPHILPPARSEGQRWKLLRALALVGADGQTPLKRALADFSRVAQRGATAVLITPTLATDWLPQLLTLQQKGLDLNVALLERQSFGAAEDGSSRGLQTALRRLGTTTHLVHQSDLGQPLAEVARRGFWEFKVTGTGKVVAVQQPEARNA